MANQQINQILQDLYELDAGLKKHEEELIKIINKILVSKPDTKFDEAFAKRLKAQLLQKQQPNFGLNLFNFKSMDKIGYTVGVLAIITVLIVPALYMTSIGDYLISPIVTGQVDDWQYNPSAATETSRGSSSSGGGLQVGLQYGAYTGLRAKSMDMGAAAPVAAESTIGYSVGGAKDVNNFRENIKNDYLPLPTDITYEGLFYDYFFDTGKQEECDKLFCPSYSTALSPDPLSDKQEYYLAVGLNSGIKESDFSRKKLNLTVVLDISGSMGSAFNKYYYDRFGKQVEIEEVDINKSKMEIAAKSVVSLTDHLNNRDEFGMVLFNNNSFLAKPMSQVAITNMGKIRDHILEIQANGGTNMSVGMREATGLYDELDNIDPTEYENRIIFLTDAMPNLGDTSKTGLLGMTKTNAEKGIYTTFIGIGVDFNTELIEAITKIKGANYYSVHSATEFDERMDEGFDYMVTPLVFDLNLKLVAEGYDIEKVYGSPEANESTGEIMKVNTLFPSKSEGGEVKGGLVLLKLKKISDDGNLVLKVSYKDRNGNKYSDEKIIEFNTRQTSYFDNTGIRKGILLSRYVNLIKNWIIDERSSLAEDTPVVPRVTFDEGIILPSPKFTLGRWERQSVPLQISEVYKTMFGQFKSHFTSEMNEIGDNTLQQEIEVLNTLNK